MSASSIWRIRSWWRTGYRTRKRYRLRRPLWKGHRLALGPAYAVERPLGEGGFAVVFLVRDLALKRNLAVKVLSPDMITSKTVLERFRREAETVAQLSHPNIVPLHFIGQQDDLLYLAMQCVEGGSIAERLQKETRLPVADAVRITCEVAAALTHAHKRGVIHRDIKPANVLVDPESGRSLVTDFGIARTADAATLTATGMMLGTPAYLAPEQVTGESLDHRVDIFALGVMAYEMIAGRVPFDGATPTAAMMKRLAGPPESLAKVRPEVPAEVAAAINGCLVADPAARFQSAADVVRALDGDLVTSGSRSTRNERNAARPAGGGDGRLTPRSRLLVATVLAAVIGIAVWQFKAPRTDLPGGGTKTNAAASAAAMVAIPAGEYAIGSERGPAMVRPRHTARVAAFSIERTEVTVAAYQAFIAATAAPSPWTGATPAGEMPVTRVTYGDAENYCAWKYPRTGRLPSELEWEAAARGAEGREYPYGSALSAAAANTESAHRAGPAPVGSFPRSATPDGVHDMSGNVWEWTSSPATAYPGGTAMADAAADAAVYRVIRGGAFNTPDSLATSWMRAPFKVTATPNQLENTGFRCVTAVVAGERKSP